jgi:multisubunit Na+/H+ antiporter MnhG subunit
MSIPTSRSAAAALETAVKTSVGSVLIGLFFVAMLVPVVATFVPRALTKQTVSTVSRYHKHMSTSDRFLRTAYGSGSW